MSDIQSKRYTSPKSLALDPATGAGIQRELERGRFREPADLIAHALDLLEAEEAAEDWLLRNREAINQRLDESFAQSEHGESSSPQVARTILAVDDLPARRDLPILPPSSRKPVNPPHHPKTTKPPITIGDLYFQNLA